MRFKSQLIKTKLLLKATGGRGWGEMDDFQGTTRQTANYYAIKTKTRKEWDNFSNNCQHRIFFKFNKTII